MTNDWLNEWLVDLVVQGELVRLALQDLDVDTKDGRVLRYVAGLLEEPQAAAGDESISLKVRLPELDADAYDDAVVVVRHLAAGDVLEQATLVLQGRVTGSSWDVPGGEADLEVTSTVGAQGLPFLDPRGVVDDTTWPVSIGSSFVESQRGIAYPLILGFPGYVAEDGIARAVVPVPLVEWLSSVPASSHLVVADRPLVAGSLASTVYVEDAGREVETVDDLDWSPMLDARQRSVTAATMTFLVLPDLNEQESSKFYAGYAPETGGGAWREAYDVIVGILREYASDTVDWDRMAAVEEPLAGFLVDTWVNTVGLQAQGDRPPAWSWIEQVLVPHLPVVLRRSGAGRFYLQWDRWWATPLDAGGELVAEHGDCDRRSPVTWSSSGVVNEVSALYQDARTGFGAQRTYTAQAERLSQTEGDLDDRILAHPLAAESQARFGLRREDPVELAWCWDTATALRVLEVRLERMAIPPREVTYWVREGHRLRPGDVRLLTDGKRGWSRRVAIVADEPMLVATGGIVKFRVR